MFKTILRKLAETPKTYYPIVTVICLWLLEPLGIEITPEIRDSLTVILMAVATALIRRNMIKTNEAKKIEDSLAKATKELEGFRREMRSNTSDKRLG